MITTARKFAGRSVLLGLFVASMGMPLVALGLSVGAGSHESTAFAFPAPVHQTADTAAAQAPAGR